jgi:UDP-3-O-[3-hydroxymyristoyl] glucosamine N-acyltransferase
MLCVADLASFHGGELIGGGYGVVSAARRLVAPDGEAPPLDATAATLIDSAGDLEQFLAGQSSAAFVAARYRRDGRPDRPQIVVADPLRSFLITRRYFAARGRLGGESIAASAVVHPAATIGHGTLIGPFVCISADVVVGEHCVLEAGSVVGAGARLGAGTVLRAGAKVGDGTVIGRACEIGEGAFVGADASVYLVSDTGWARDDGDGTLLIGHETDVGPQCVIERGHAGSTRVGPRCTVGGQVYVGHDTVVDAGAVIMVRCAVGSSCHIGSGATVMACVSINPGAQVGDNAIVRGGSVVYGKVGAATDVFGNPAIARRQGLNALGAARRVTDLRRRVRALEHEARPPRPGAPQD